MRQTEGDSIQFSIEDHQSPVPSPPSWDGGHAKLLAEGEEMLAGCSSQDSLCLCIGFRCGRLKVGGDQRPLMRFHRSGSESQIHVAVEQVLKVREWLEEALHKGGESLNYTPIIKELQNIGNLFFQ